MIARVLPDVAGLDKTFDYLVPDALADRVRVGTLVRIELQGRRVGGWVVDVDVEPPPGVALQPLAKVTGWGPAGDLVDLAAWAAWRWAGRPRALLTTASPPGAVVALPAIAPAPVAPVVVPDPLALGIGSVVDDGGSRAVVRLPPAADPMAIVVDALGRGETLVVAPSVAAARLLGARLRRAGIDVALHPRDWARAAAGAHVVVGARAAAWAPRRRLAAVVVLDEHDEALQEERAPTWHARDVAVERARRACVPCVVVSPVPSLEALAWGTLVTPSRADERAGWPICEIVDRTRDDPLRRSLITDALVRHLRSGARVVVVHNTPGVARLLACAACGQVTRCARCDAAVAMPDAAHLHCPRCGTDRPIVCQSCGATRLKARRLGVARLRDELEAIAGAPVVAVTAGSQDPVAAARVHVGTEAVLHRVDAADVVVFADFDAELTAPRYRAEEQALALLARAARLVGGRPGGGRVVVQTGMGRHPVLDAVLHADPGRLVAGERAKREVLGFPPAVALAEVSGGAADAFVAGLGADVEALGPADGRWLVRAPDHRRLCDALARAPRPPGRLRIAVDPLRI